MKKYYGTKKLKLSYDLPFKMFLTSICDDNTMVLKGFLESYLKKEVRTIELLPNELNTIFGKSKNIRLDLFVKINDEEYVDIEMQKQITWEVLGKRSRYYASVIITHLVQQGTAYTEMMPLHQIFLLDCNVIDDLDYYHCFEMSEKNRDIVLTDKVKVHMIELRKSTTNVQDYCTLDKPLQWAILFNEYVYGTTNQRLLKMMQSCAEFRKAEDVMEAIFNDEDFLSRAFGEEKRKADIIAFTTEARKIGKAEERLKMTLKMLDHGMDVNLISETTGLKCEEILKLQSDIKS